MERWFWARHLSHWGPGEPEIVQLEANGIIWAAGDETPYSRSDWDFEDEILHPGGKTP